MEAEPPVTGGTATPTGGRPSSSSSVEGGYQAISLRPDARGEAKPRRRCRSRGEDDGRGGVEIDLSPQRGECPSRYGRVSLRCGRWPVTGDRIFRVRGRDGGGDGQRDDCALRYRSGILSTCVVYLSSEDVRDGRMKLSFPHRLNPLRAQSLPTPDGPCALKPRPCAQEYDLSSLSFSPAPSEEPWVSRSPRSRRRLFLPWRTDGLGRRMRRSTAGVTREVVGGGSVRQEARRYEVDPGRRGGGRRKLGLDEGVSASA